MSEFQRISLQQLLQCNVEYNNSQAPSSYACSHTADSCGTLTGPFVGRMHASAWKCMHQPSTHRPCYNGLCGASRVILLAYTLNIEGEVTVWQLLLRCLSKYAACQP